jgi:uncharacterized protein with HEPN domain
MKPKHARRVPEYLQHILDAIDRATGYVNGLDFTGFEADTRTQDAVIRSIEIIGEAANKTRVADPDFAARHPNIPWDLMYGIASFTTTLKLTYRLSGRRYTATFPLCGSKSTP